MRNWINLFENNVAFPAGSTLYHATDGDYDRSAGPMWFAHREDDARQHLLIRGAEDIRVKRYQTTRTLRLLDAESNEAIGQMYDDEVDARDIAEHILSMGYDGWIDDGEVMIGDRSAVTLLPIRESANPNLVKVYHGTERDTHETHRRMFFSTSREFASNYGNDIHTYMLDEIGMLDSLDEDLISEILPVYDPYDDVEINSFEEYQERASDTWEIIEEYADSIVSRHGATGLIIYEGGCKNFMVYDTSCLRKIDSLTEGVAPDLLDGIDMTTFETFWETFRRRPREQITGLNDILLRQRAEHERPYEGWTTLYHGTTEKIAATITQQGFALTKGKRAVGGMGALISVDNQGIFLADSAQLATYFGRNRSSDNQNKTIRVQVDTSRVLSTDDASLQLKKIGLRLLNEYNGSTKTRLAVRDWWWLLDQPEFVLCIKSEGYTGVRFKEETSVRRDAGVMDGHTYCVFDPKAIRLPDHDGVSVRDFYEWLKAS